MGEETFIYQYVNIPHNGVGDEVEMINILTPIVNMDEKNNLYGNAITLSQPINYDMIIKSEENGDDGEGEKDPDGKFLSDTDLDMKRYERLQRDIHRKKVARLRESDEQRHERLKKDRMRKKHARLNESNEQRKMRLEKDRLRIQKRRAQESEDERRKRLERNRISKRNARVKENNSGGGSSSASSSSSDILNA